jgi:hypothetical protein
MKKVIIGAAVTVAAGVFLAATGWLFASVADLPEEYVMKRDHDLIEQQNKEDHKRIERKIDLIIEHLIKDE